MDTINWGMIGCGSVTEIKSGPAFNKVDHSMLMAVMGRDSAKAAAYAARHEVPHWYDNAADLVNDPRINAIYVATPPDSHLEYARMAMLAGKPVYVEKPMARNAAECETMNTISRETGVPLFVAYYRRALPYFVKIRDLIHEGAIGDIRSVEVRLHKLPHPDETRGNTPLPWRVIPEIAGGGHFHDLAAHQLDFLEFALGPIRHATGFARNQAGLYPADDCVVASLEFESGALGSGNWCFTAPIVPEIDEAWIIGSHGRIGFSFFKGHTITVERSTEYEVYNCPYPPHVQQPLIDLIVRSLRGGTSSPSTGLTGARASIWMDRITART